MIFFIGWLFAAIIIGVIGSERTIGFFWSFLGSLLLSPLIGLIFVLTSERKSDREYKEKMLRYMKGEVVSSVEVDKLKELRGNFQKKTIKGTTQNSYVRNGVLYGIIGSVVLVIVFACVIDYFSDTKKESRNEMSKSEIVSAMDDLIYRIKNDLAYSRTEIDTTFKVVGKINTLVDGFDVVKVNLWNKTGSGRSVSATLVKDIDVCIMGEENGYLLVGTPKAASFEWGYCLPEYVNR